MHRPSLALAALAADAYLATPPKREDFTAMIQQSLRLGADAAKNGEADRSIAYIADVERYRKLRLVGVIPTVVPHLWLLENAQYTYSDANGEFSDDDFATVELAAAALERYVTDAAEVPLDDFSACSQCGAQVSEQVVRPRNSLIDAGVQVMIHGNSDLEALRELLPNDPATVYAILDAGFRR